MLIPFVISGFSALFAITIVFLFPFAFMFLRWRSLRNALYSVIAWNVYTLSFFPGFIRSRVPPTSWIESTLLKEGVPSDRAREFAVRVPMANHDSENGR